MQTQRTHARWLINQRSLRRFDASPAGRRRRATKPCRRPRSAAAAAGAGRVCSYAGGAGRRPWPGGGLCDPVTDAGRYGPSPGPRPTPGAAATDPPQYPERRRRAGRTTRAQSSRPDRHTRRTPDRSGHRTLSTSSAKTRQSTARSRTPTCYRPAPRPGLTRPLSVTGAGYPVRLAGQGPRTRPRPGFPARYDPTEAVMSHCPAGLGQR